MPEFKNFIKGFDEKPEAKNPNPAPTPKPQEVKMEKPTAGDVLESKYADAFYKQAKGNKDDFVNAFVSRFGVPQGFTRNEVADRYGKMFDEIANKPEEAQQTQPKEAQQQKPKSPWEMETTGNPEEDKRLERIIEERVRQGYDSKGLYNPYTIKDMDYLGFGSLDELEKNTFNQDKPKPQPKQGSFQEVFGDKDENYEANKRENAKEEGDLVYNEGETNDDYLKGLKIGDEVSIDGKVAQIVPPMTNSSTRDKTGKVFFQYRVYPYRTGYIEKNYGEAIKPVTDEERAQAKALDEQARKLGYSSFTDY